MSYFSSYCNILLKGLPVLENDASYTKLNLFEIITGVGYTSVMRISLVKKRLHPHLWITGLIISVEK